MYSSYLKKKRWIKACFVLALCLIMGISATAQQKPYEGKKISIGVLAGGPHGAISGPLYFWRDAWEERTGAKLEIVEIPYPQLYGKVMMDFITGMATYDGVVVAYSYYGDLIGGNYVIPIDEYYGDPKFPQWSKDTVLPPLRNTWGGKWYGPPYDSDAQALYYRRDILSDATYQKEFKTKYGYELPVPPKTWAQLYDVAQFFTGRDWNGDGEDDYGFTLPVKRGINGFFHFLNMAIPFVVAPGPVDRYHGCYYFDPVTMEPLINTPGNVKALEILVSLLKFAPADVLSYGMAEGWDVFLRGKAVLTWSWGDVGALAEDPDKSVIMGKCGCAPMPGSMETWDREHKRWIKWEVPHFVGNSTGAWHGLISRYTENPELVYDLFAFHASEKISMWSVYRGWTGVDIGRTFHFLPPYGPASLEGYLEEGWYADDVKEFSSAYYKTFSAETMMECLGIPGTWAYWDTLDDALAQAYLGKLTPKQALDKVYHEWEEITNRLGRERQKELYQINIGYKK